MSPFDEVGDRVFRRRYASLDLNVGVVIGATGVLVVDTREGGGAAHELQTELVALTKQPVVAVVNTHFHWDHVWGNSRFRRVPIWGHVRCRAYLEEHGEEMRGEVMETMPETYGVAAREVETVPPNRTFSATAVVDLGDRRVWLSYHGRAHTDSDIIVRVPDAGVVFLGDVIEEGAPPQFGSAYPEEWPATLDAIDRHLEATLVPGHGDVVGRSFFNTQREEIIAVARAVREHLAGADEPPRGPYPPATMRQAYERQQQVRGVEGPPPAR